MTGPHGARERLASGGSIDRGRTLRFRFDGREYAGHPGDTLASALLAHGVHRVARSFKYHRPRGILSAGFEEPNALVELGTGETRVPNTPATTIELVDGLEALSQNRWPSLRFDLRAVNKVIYLTSPNLATVAGPVWYTLRASWPALAAYAHFLVQPRAAILRLLANVRVTHHGTSTTYESRRTRVALGAVGATGRPSTGAIDVRLTTGAQGEFTGLWASLTSGAATTTVSMSVVSYNRPVSITAPVKGSATTPAGPLLKQLLSSGVLGSFVLPTRWLQLLSRAKLS